MTGKRAAAAIHPITFWRISNYLSLSGEGGLEFEGRWHSMGRPIVYLAESPAGALLEILAHLEFEDDEFPSHFQLLRIDASAPIEVMDVPVPAKKDWESDQVATRRLGDAWLLEGRSLLARVPSAIMPQTWNCLFNPLHPDAGKLRIADSIRHPYDPRLLRRHLKQH